MSQIDWTKAQNWIGPFPCRPGSDEMSLWMSFGPSKQTKVVSARANCAGNETWISAELVNQYPTYSVQILKFEHLAPNTEYRYEVFVDGEKWFGDGLTDASFTFHTFPKPGKSYETVFMSCHGIEAYQNDPNTNAEDTWNMWKRLADTMDENENIRLGILGGDQVYMDDTFTEDISKFNPDDHQLTRLMVYKTYLKYWGAEEYRKVMVRLPCYLMWDDHDIIDGWGSRNEQIKTTLPDKIREFISQKIISRRYLTTKEKWRHYGSHLFIAFDEMQSSRNPPSIKNGVSSFIKKIDRTAILALDMRRERGIQDEDGSMQILSKSHQKAIETEVDNLGDASSVYIVSPVTLARMSGKIEFILGSVSNFMWQLGSLLSYRKSPLRVGYWTTLFLSGYWILYSESTILPGVLQAGYLFLFTLIITLFNRENLQEYFPKKGNIIKYTSYGICASLLLYIYESLKRISGNEILDSRKFLSIEDFKFSQVDSLIGSCLSVLVILYFSFLNWSVANKKIRKWYPDKKPFAKIKGMLMIVGVIALIILSVFNWWRGLPGVETNFQNVILLLPYSLLGICVFTCFVMALLEGMGVVDTIAGLNDDVLDAWSSPEHIESLKWFRNLIIKMSDGGKRKIYLLCGDIHTGGLSEISFTKPEDADIKFKIFQITSSPMSYVTMPALVEKITSGVGKIPLKDSQREDAALLCEFTNIFFRSQRNFVIYKPQEDKLLVSFFFEDLENPVIHVI